MLGYDDRIRVHERSVKAQPDDIFMLASDGLMKSIKSYIWPKNDKNMGKYVTRSILTSNDIREIVNGNKFLHIAAEEIIKEASRKRPDINDDRTVVIIRALRAD